MSQPSSTSSAGPKLNLSNDHKDASQDPSNVLYMPTEQAYAHWASVYDTDGNFLQATDDWELEERLPRFLALSGLQPASSVANSATPSPPVEPTTIIDLGCGTGRNTYKTRALTDPKTTQVIGLDNSQEMLDIARQKKAGCDGSHEPPIFARFDINDPARTFTELTVPGGCIEQSKPYPAPAYPNHPSIPLADIVLSTLVIEHLEADQYFTVASKLLKPNGFLLLTNMHFDMGTISQAGFVNEDGVKVRPRSIPHTVTEICNVAMRHGFEVLDVAEREIREEDVGRLGARSRKWVGIKCWFGISFRRVPLA